MLVNEDADFFRINSTPAALTSASTAAAIQMKESSADTSTRLPVDGPPSLSQPNNNLDLLSKMHLHQQPAIENVDGSEEEAPNTPGISLSKLNLQEPITSIFALLRPDLLPP